jgi:hypothetical protein
LFDVRLGIGILRILRLRRRRLIAATDRPVLLLDVLLVRRGDIARTLEQDARRITAAEGATKSEFEIFKAFDGLRAKISGGAGVLEVLRVRHLTKVVDRFVELLRRDAVLREFFAQRFRVGETLRGFSAELLRVVWCEALTRETAATRNATGILVGSAHSGLLAVATLLPAALLTAALLPTLLSALLASLLAVLLTTLLAPLLATLLPTLLTALLAALLTTLLTSLLTALLTILLAALLPALLTALRSAILLTALLSALLSVLPPVLLAILLTAGLLLTVLLAVLLAASLLAVLLTIGIGLLTILTILLLPVLAVLLTVLLALTTRSAVLLRALTHTFIHRLEAAHEIARFVSRLRILTLTVAPLRRSLCLLDALAKVRDVTRNRLLRLIHPFRRRISRLLLCVSELFFDLATANRIGRMLERA